MAELCPTCGAEMIPIVLHTTQDREPSRVRAYERMPNGRIKMRGRSGRPQTELRIELEPGDILGFECAGDHAPVSYCRATV